MSSRAEAGQSALQQKQLGEEDNQNRPRESVLENNGYLLQETVGTGAFSNRAYSKTANQTVAIKIISKQKATKDVLNKFLPREIDLVRGLRHTNLIRFFECIETTMRFYIVMEYAENGSLLQLIRKEKSLSEERAKSYFKQLIDAVEYIHSVGVVHRDIKCENIVFDQRFTLKLIDFGFARGNMKPLVSGEKMKPILSKTFCGSHAYASPEILKSIPYQPQLSDIWAVGVVLYTMVFGRLPFANENNVSLLIKQVSAGPKFPKDRGASDNCKDLILKILRPVNLRISVEEMRNHAWLNEPHSNCDDSEFEKKMKLDPTLEENPDEHIRKLIHCKFCKENKDLQCTTVQKLYNRKKAGPKKF
ncbi:testis-specific serine/threonine-protein kinase 3-like isoform X2 [Toxorhynchites rutilus septentrionalis]|uniref:testis-specific serine/threonine-protein kinase 3-like isoform X2 n=1 Tax=Toxorhynchites rutilus septentrionalis TaxID=329112 RepID=UPI00247AC22B|nr:testis-specific serine/threonine-protein kinase 3-like isoform X2 [Toxorhynchites rutilus septentrionalis]